MRQQDRPCGKGVITKYVDKRTVENIFESMRLRGSLEDNALYVFNAFTSGAKSMFEDCRPTDAECWPNCARRFSGGRLWFSLGTLET